MLILFFVAMFNGSATVGLMTIPLILAYVFWLFTLIDRDDAWELVDKIIKHYNALADDYNNLINEYNELVEDYNNLEDKINENTVKVELVDENVDDQTES